MGQFHYNALEILIYLSEKIFRCYWHACIECFPDDQMLVAGETAENVRAKNARREAEIEEELDLEIFWECEIHRMLSKDSEMRKFFENCLDTGSINLR